MLKRTLIILFALMLICGALAEALPDQYDSISRIPGADGLYAMRLDDLWGIVNREGEILIEPSFHSEPEFSGGYAVVAERNPDAKKDLSDVTEYGSFFGVIDAEGRIIVPPEYDSIEISAAEGVILAEKDEKFGFMNLQGEIFIPLAYDRAQMFTGDYAAVAKNFDLGDENRDSAGFTSCWGMIDRSGRELIPLGYDWLETSANGIASAQWEGKYCYINAENKSITDFKYRSAGQFTDGYAAVAIEVALSADDAASSEPYGAAWGAIDESGREVVPCIYDSLTMCEGGLALIRRTSDGDYGYINMQNEIIVEPTLFRAEPFIGGHAAVGRKYEQEDGSASFTVLWGAIDAGGREVLPLEYNRVKTNPDGSIEAWAGDIHRSFRVENGAAVEIP